MNRSPIYPLWVFVAVAAAIAGVALAIGQAVPGFGIVSVALATSIWVGHVAIVKRRPDSMDAH